MKISIVHKSNKFYEIAFLIILFFNIAGCTTTKIASQKFDNTNTHYDKFAIFFAEQSLIRKKTSEDKIVEYFSSEGIRATQGYKIYQPKANYSAEDFLAAVINSGADAVVVISRTSDTRDVYTTYGTSVSNAIDTSGKIYTYELPTSESYTTSSRRLKTLIIDVKRNKIVWQAESEIKTLSPAELGMFTDFYETSISRFSSNLLDQMKNDGLIGSK